MASGPITSWEIDGETVETDICITLFIMGLPQWLSSKESTCNGGDTGDSGSIPASGGSSGGGNGNLLQNSCLENPMDGGAWWAAVLGAAKSWTRLRY